MPIQSTNKFTGARAPDLYNKLAIRLRINAEKPLHNIPLKKKSELLRMTTILDYEIRWGGWGTDWTA